MPNRIVYIGLLVCSCVLWSCSLFKKEDQENAIARAGDAYLYQDEVTSAIPPGLNNADSLIWVNSYVSDWARRQLFLQKAEVNLNTERQDQLKGLIEEYQNDLFIKVYKEALTDNAVDTSVNLEEITSYYEANKINFRLNENLLKLRYITIGKQYYNVPEVTSKLKRFNASDKIYLDSIALQFKAFSLNDSIWVKAAHVYQRIPLFKQQNPDKYLKKSQFFTLEDSLDIYLVHVNDVLPRGELAPLEYVMPTVKQIMVNRRKVEYLRQLDKDILNDAIKNKQFEVYE